MVFFNLLPIIIISIPMIIKKEKVNNLIDILFYGQISVLLPFLIMWLYKYTFISNFLTNNYDVNIAYLDKFIDLLFTAGIAEELSKFICIKMCKAQNKKGILVTCILIGLIFSVIENFGYVQKYYMNLTLTRIIVPVHIILQLIMAFFLIKASESKSKYKKLEYNLLALIVPIILHTLYDTFASANIIRNYIYYFGILFYPLIIYTLLKVENNIDNNIQIKKTKFKAIKIILIILMCLFFIYADFGTKYVKFGTSKLIDSQNIVITLNDTKQEIKHIDSQDIKCYSIDMTIKNNNSTDTYISSFKIKDKNNNLTIYPINRNNYQLNNSIIKGNEQSNITISFDINEIKNLGNDYYLVYEDEIDSIKILFDLK